MFTVIILAGGLATRMRPATEKIPKSLLQVSGKPFIYHQLTNLAKKNVTKVILCLGHLGEQVENYVMGNDFPLDMSFSYDGDKLLGTGGATLKAIWGIKTPFFVLYGDSYLDVDYNEIANIYNRCGKPGLMTVYRNNDYWDNSNVVFQDDVVTNYSKTKRSHDMKYIDYGLSILSPEVFTDYERGTAFDLAEVYEKLSRSRDLFGYEVFNRFYEIGSQKGIMDLEEHLNGECN